ncbi:hypothetical protein DL96DRAFT_828913 [Flagelloscypha sp. PMI_526]|nr:hypothetical protein DL96DRAFT_828913 [Flagelloscypha sp. PMI_526]
MSFQTRDDIPLPSDRTIISCDSHEGQGNSSTFELPFTARLLYIESAGGGQAGHVTISSSTDVAQDSVLVRINSRPANSRVTVHAKVCRMEKNGEHGVGIYTPRHTHPPERHGEHIDVHFTLPRTISSNRRIVKALSTNLNNYSVEFTLQDNFSFETLALGTHNGKITYKAPNVQVSKNTTLKTNNGAIAVEKIDVLDNIQLHTLNGSIDARVALQQTTNNSATGVIKTTNGSINATYDLTTSASGPGSFNLTANTTNSFISKNIRTAPADSTLYVSSETSNGSNEVTLPPVFEGKFNLSTSLSGAEVRVDERVQDPKGLGRRRRVEKSASSGGSWSPFPIGNVEGAVFWDQAGRERGRVIVKSSVGKVILNV